MVNTDTAATTSHIALMVSPRCRAMVPRQNAASSASAAQPSQDKPFMTPLRWMHEASRRRWVQVNAQRGMRLRLWLTVRQVDAADWALTATWRV